MAAHSPLLRRARTRLSLRTTALAAIFALVVGGTAFAATTPATAASAPAPASKTTVINGDLKITKAGTVINSYDIRGQVFVNAANVTIANSVIRGSASGSYNSLVNAMGDHPGLKIWNTEIYAQKPNPNINGVQGSEFELHNVNIHDVIDQVHIVGNNVWVDNSYLHDNVHYVKGQNGATGASHDDNIQIEVGTNIRVTNNTMSGAYNTGLQIAQDKGKVSNVTYTGNKADGGGCSFNVSQKSYGPVKGITITGNTFGRHQRLANCAVISPASTVINFSNNKYTDGAVVKIFKGA